MKNLKRHKRILAKEKTNLRFKVKRTKNYHSAQSNWTKICGQFFSKKSSCSRPKSMNPHSTASETYQDILQTEKNTNLINHAVFYLVTIFAFDLSPDFSLGKKSGCRG